MARVLLVDDEKSIRITLGEFLRNGGHDVAIAADVADALPLIEESEFDVFVCDILLPQGSGLALLNTCRERCPNAQVVLITGEPALDTASAAVRERAFDYLAKPVTKELLLDVVERAFRVKSHEDEHDRLQEENRRYREELEQLVAERTRELRQSEERYRRIVETAHEGIWMIDMEGNTTFANPRMAEMLGSSVDELRAGAIWDFVDEGGRRDAEEKLARRRSGIAERHEFRFIRRDGSELWALVGAKPFTDDAGEPVGVLGMIADITDRREAELAVEEASTKLRTFFDTIDDYLFVLDSRGDVLDCNTAAERCLGYSREEMRGMSVALLHPPERREEAGQIVADMLAGKRDICPIPLLTKDGGLVPVETKVVQGRWGTQDVLFGVSRDMTNARQAERALRASEERYRTLVEGVAQPIFSVSEEGRFLYVNRAAAETFDCQPEDIVGKAIADLFPPELAEKHLAEVHEALDSGAPVTLETETLILGKPRSLQMRITPSPDSGDGVRSAYCIGFDLTERMEAERAIRESEERYRSYVDNSPDGIFIADSEGRYLDVNPAASRITGYSREELLRMSVADLLTPEGSEAGRDHFRSVLQTGRASGAIPFRAKSGEIRWWTVEAVRLSDGHLLGLTKDITDLRNAQEALRESEEHYRVIFERGPICIATVGLDLRFESVNDAFCEFVGYSADEMRELTIPDVTFPEDRSQNLELQTQLADGTIPSYRLEKRFVRKDGEVVWGVLVASLIHDSEGAPAYFLGQVLDITEQKRSDAEKRAMAGQLHEAQKLESIGTLAGGVAHEVNNPINGIMNYARLISDALPAGDKYGGFAREIIYETERVATIVRDLLTFARRDMQMHKPVRPEEIIESTVSLIRTLLKRDQIVLQVDVERGLPELDCRAQQIRQVLMNLLTNARDALNDRFPDSGVEKKMALLARHARRGDAEWVRLIVEDNGGGIPLETRDRIFDPFFTTKPRDIGTGLGLSTSHGIVREHGGSLRVESGEGDFTRFIVDLPARAGQD